MPQSLQASLSKLIGSPVIISAGNGYPEHGQTSAMFRFENGTWLQAEYWRLSENGAPSYSSFDRHQQYGLPAAVDALQELQKRLNNMVVAEALLDEETGDLLFRFNGGTRLQILNVTGYEIWEIRFPDGTGEYSNYAK